MVGTRLADTHHVPIQDVILRFAAARIKQYAPCVLQGRVKTFIAEGVNHFIIPTYYKRIYVTIISALFLIRRNFAGRWVADGGRGVIEYLLSARVA